MLGSCLLQKTHPCGDGSHVSITQRRAKSLDRRTLDAIKTVSSSQQIINVKDIGNSKWILLDKYGS